MKPTLIVKLPNWVGDTVMSLPALEVLDASGIGLCLVGKPFAKHLLSGLPYPIKIEPPGLLNKVLFWRGLAPSHVLSLTQSLSSRLYPALAQKCIIGYRGGIQQMFLSVGVQKMPGLHQVERYHQLALAALETLNQPIAKTLPQHGFLPVSEHALQSANQLLEAHGLEHYVILVPTAHGLHHGRSKVWPEFGRLFCDISKQYPVVICPGVNEVDAVKAAFPKALLLKDVALDVYAALCHRAHWVISNDTGPMHIAAAVNPKTLGIFGVTSPQDTRPWGGHYMGEDGLWPSVDGVLQKLMNL